MEHENQYYITGQNDIFLYYEVMDQIKPESVLDIGMLLKRVGAISRQIKGREIERGIVLDGVDFRQEIHAGVYEMVYDHIYGLDNWMTDRQYELCFMFCAEGYISLKKQEDMALWLRKHTRYLVTDMSQVEAVFAKNAECRALYVEDSRYYIVIFGKDK